MAGASVGTTRLTFDEDGGLISVELDGVASDLTGELQEGNTGLFEYDLSDGTAVAVYLGPNGRNIAVADNGGGAAALTRDATALPRFSAADFASNFGGSAFLVDDGFNLIGLADATGSVAAPPAPMAFRFEDSEGCLSAGVLNAPDPTLGFSQGSFSNQDGENCLPGGDLSFYLAPSKEFGVAVACTSFTAASAPDDCAFLAFGKQATGVGGAHPLTGNWYGTADNLTDPGGLSTLQFSFDHGGDLDSVLLNGADTGVSGELQGVEAGLFQYALSDGTSLSVYLDQTADNIAAADNADEVAVLSRDAGSLPEFLPGDLTGQYEGAQLSLDESYNVVERLSASGSVAGLPAPVNIQFEDGNGCRFDGSLDVPNPSFGLAQGSFTNTAGTACLPTGDLKFYLAPSKAFALAVGCSSFSAAAVPQECALIPVNKTGAGDGVTHPLSGTWFGTADNIADAGGFVTIDLAFNQLGEITSVRLDGQDGGVTGEQVNDGNGLFEYQLSDGTGMAIRLGQEGRNLALADTLGEVAVLTRGATLLPGFSDSDLPGSYDGLSFRVDAAFTVTGATSASATLASPPLPPLLEFKDGSGCEFSGSVNSAVDAGFGVAVGDFTNTAGPVSCLSGGEVKLYLAPSKDFALAVACSGFLPGNIPQECAFIPVNRQ